MPRLRGGVINRAEKYIIDNLSRQEVTAGDLAAYLSRQKGTVQQSTLERAMYLGQTEQRLQEINIHPGDRLAFVLALDENPERLPPLLGLGDRHPVFTIGDRTLPPNYRRRLTLGTPDRDQNFIPDVDLTTFVHAPSHLPHLRGKLLEMHYEQQRWTLIPVHSGVEIFMDEIPLNAQRSLSQNLALYFRVGGKTLLAISVQLQAITDRRPTLMPGNEQVEVIMGYEDDILTLNASAALSLREIAQHVIQYKTGRMRGDFRIYLLQLVAPQTSLHALFASGSIDALYATHQTAFSQSVLTLRSAQNPNQETRFSADIAGKTFLLGRRSKADQREAHLDMDLYDMAQGQHNRISRQQAQLTYRDDNWVIRQDGRAPLYINSYRLAHGSEQMLSSGDVLSFGPTVEEYIVRLVVDIQMTHR